MQVLSDCQPKALMRHIDEASAHIATFAYRVVLVKIL